jgi:acyl carrier protein
MTSSEGTPPRPEDLRSRDELEAFLRTGLAAALGISADAVERRQTFTTFGLDSIKAFALTGDLAEWMDRDLPATLFWDHPNIEALTRFVAEALGLPE